ncbi:DUF6927 domain-containing protein [Neptuniibacter sp. QD37_11]|uniref:DUF6927 domain-containing protein n=1 Tax=Neptuniibacter sp. QD37_11 TaxID=3398209 RepID=UPI0039F63336
MIEYRRKGCVAYLAIENRRVETDEVLEVWVSVALISQKGSEVCLKYVSEDAGPAEDECPKSILDKLTPTDKKSAVAWRERCRQFADMEPLKDGDLVEFEDALTFRGPAGEFTGKRFRVRKEGRKTRFTCLENNTLCQITHYKRRPYKMILEA